MLDARYKVHMVSFANTENNGYNVIFGKGENLQEWHIPVLERYVEDLKAELAKQTAAEDFSDLV